MEALPDLPLLAWIALGVLAPLLSVIGWLGISHVRAHRYHRYKGLELPALGLLGHLRVYARELAAFFTLGLWHLRAWFAEGWRGAPAAGRPVVLLHGFTQNGTNWWGMRRALEALGRPTLVVSMGRPLRSIEAHARKAAAALREAAERASDFDVVAHSMGGVVLRWVLAEYPELARAVRRVVTLGSPHAGTAGTRGLRAPRTWDVRQLARHSDFLEALPAFAQVAPQAEVTTIAAERDWVVYPASTCHQPGARTIELPGVGHAGLLTAPEALRTVIDVLRDGATATGGAEPAAK